MKQNTRGRAARLLPSPSMVVALIALVVALSGTAYAAATINGKNIKKGTITSKQVKDKSLTGTDIKDGSILKADLSSSVGTIGPQGPKGDPGSARAYANVTNAPALVPERTSGFIAVRRNATGQYCVQLSPSLGIDPTKVAPVATMDLGASSDTVGIVEVRGSNLGGCNSDEVTVYTETTAGAATNGVGFTLLIP